MSFYSWPSGMPSLAFFLNRMKILEATIDLFKVRFWQLNISASNEGIKDLNISKPLFSTCQVKEMKKRADTLLLQLQQLAARYVSGIEVQ